MIDYDNYDYQYQIEDDNDDQEIEEIEELEEIISFDIDETTINKNENFYIRNKDLLKELIESKEKGELTKNAVKMFILLSERIVSRMSYVNQYLKEEAISGAKLDLLLYWKGFNPKKSTNAFSYLSQIAKNGLAKSFNKCYKLGKKFKGTILRIDGSSHNSDSEGIYSI